MHRLVSFFVGFAVFLLSPQSFSQEARQTPISMCQAIADAGGIIRASAGGPALRLAQLGPGDVNIRYVGHSTFRIEDATGLVVATDYSGQSGVGRLPDIVTMNNAHITHWTPAPDPAIPHVLEGWGRDGIPADYNIQIGEVIVRNVTTDVNSQWAGQRINGNSIFIFEMGGLCIGHLGHLHHILSDEHYAKIGRLDILMVPIDGGYTLNLPDMAAVVRRLNASMILPMHWFSEFSLRRFIASMEAGFPVDVRAQSGLTVNLNTLPPTATITVLPPETHFGLGFSP